LITLIIFSNGLGVYVLRVVVHCSIRRREMSVVGKPLAKPAAEKKFFGRYRGLTPGCRILSRKRVRSLEYRRTREGYMFINLQNVK